MDHINSLVLAAGSLDGPFKRVYAVHEVLKDIEGVFSDRLWPNLASWTENGHPSLVYTESVLSSIMISIHRRLAHSNFSLRIDGQYAQVHADISIRTMLLSHGQCRSGETYNSSAFFIRHDVSGQEFLFLGDVEPDTVSAIPRNRDLWRAAATKIPQTLSSIFIECSYPRGRNPDRLYGHLSPEHLAQELKALATEIVMAREALSRDRPLRKKQRMEPQTISRSDRVNALRGVRLYIMHFKEDLAQQWERPIHHVIVEQIQELVSQENLGVEIIATEPGMLIRASHNHAKSLFRAYTPSPIRYLNVTGLFIDNFPDLPHVFCCIISYGVWLDHYSFLYRIAGFRHLQIPYLATTCTQCR